MKITPSSISLVSFIRRHQWLVLILVLATWLLFFRTSHGDLLGDDALYSTRSIGMLDLAFTVIQPTPLQWYDAYPWWANLSWHDHPVLLFFIQHLSLSISPTEFFAKLPYALMTLGSVILMYVWTKGLFGKSIGLLAALLFTLDAHAIYLGRTALMESGVMFFILLTFCSWLAFVREKKYWWLFGLSLGLLLETKFTAFFVLPTLLVYTFIHARALFKEKRFYCAFALAMVVFLPVIIYNGMMYADRGHFALQFARLFHESSPWQLSGVNEFTIRNVSAFAQSIGQSVSFPYLFLFVTSLLYVFAYHRRLAAWPLLGLLFVTIEDLTISTKGLSSLFIPVIVAIAFHYGTLSWQRRYRFVTAGFLIAYLFLFTVNSNLLVSPSGRAGWWHDNGGQRNYGAAQLNQYLDTLEATVPDLGRFDQYDVLKIRKPSLHKYLLANIVDPDKRDVLNMKKIIVFDQNILWFSQVWLFARRGFYHDLAIFSTIELPKEARALFSPETVYFIRATEFAPLDPSWKQSQSPGQWEAPLLAAGLTPVLIARDDGGIAFKVYTITDPAIIVGYGFLRQ
ncbi:MAG: glycosyltransferase family 39 protein [Patescibacteria group bacterium]